MRLCQSLEISLPFLCLFFIGLIVFVQVDYLLGHPLHPTSYIRMPRNIRLHRNHLSSLQKERLSVLSFLLSPDNIAAGRLQCTDFEAAARKTGGAGAGRTVYTVGDVYAVVVYAVVVYVVGDFLFRLRLGL